MHVFIVYIFLSISIFPIICDQNGVTIYVKSVQCNVSEKYIFKNISCYAQSYGRYATTINVDAKAKKPLKSIFLDFSIQCKRDATYREVFQLHKVNVCKMTQEVSENKLQAMVVNIMKDTAPELIHECPYMGMTMRNLTIQTNAITLALPFGHYKMDFEISDEMGEGMNGSYHWSMVTACEQRLIRLLDIGVNLCIEQMN